jgi:hypothetical protein
VALKGPLNEILFVGLTVRIVVDACVIVISQEVMSLPGRSVPVAPFVVIVPETV